LNYAHFYRLAASRDAWLMPYKNNCEYNFEMPALDPRAKVSFRIYYGCHDTIPFRLHMSRPYYMDEASRDHVTFLCQIEVHRPQESVPDMLLT